MWIMIFAGTVTTDANGIVLYDPIALERHYPGGISEGENLLERYLQTEEGDEVLRSGGIVPVLAIDDDTYSVQIVLSPDAGVAPTTQDVVCRNAFYPLTVCQSVVVADIAQIMEWHDGFKYHGFVAPVPPGTYCVEILGFQRRGSNGQSILDAGYRFILRATDELCSLTADTGACMRVL